MTVIWRCSVCLVDDIVVHDATCFLVSETHVFLSLSCCIMCFMA